MMAQGIFALAATPIIQLALLSLLPLVLGSLLRRSLPFLSGVLRLAGQLGLFLALALTGVHMLNFPLNFELPRDDQPEQITTGGETRVRMARDGHFWVQAKANGTPRRLLVDTGATLTTLSADAADDMGAVPDPDGSRITLTTANGTTQAQLGVIPRLRIGNVIVRHLPIAVAPSLGNTNVLGMNFLSQLASWRVEGRTLILVPHHPQAIKGSASMQSETR